MRRGADQAEGDADRDERGVRQRSQPEEGERTLAVGVEVCQNTWGRNFDSLQKPTDRLKQTQSLSQIGSKPEAANVTAAGEAAPRAEAEVSKAPRVSEMAESVPTNLGVGLLKDMH